MAKCAKCGTKMLVGKLSIGESRYCSHQCAAEDFLPKLALSLERTPVEAVPPIKEEPAVLDEFGREFDGDTPGDSIKDLMIVVAGLAVVCGVSYLIRLVADLVQYPFFGQTFLFVIPLGAALCGFVAGLGFGGTIRAFDRRPSAPVYLAAVFGGVFGYLLIYYLSWWFADVQGVRLRDSIPFLDYLKLMVENQRIKVDRGGGKPIELGKIGYARFAINVLGFVFGVVGCVAAAGGREYCRKCRRFFKPVGARAVSCSDPDLYGRLLAPMIVAVKLGRIDEALEIQSGLGIPDEPGYLTTKIQVESCPNCGLHKGTLTTTVPDDNGARTLEAFGASGYTAKPVVVGRSNGGTAID